MKSNVTEAEVEQFARYNVSRAKARGATPMPFSYHLSGARTHFAMGGTMPAEAASFAPPAPMPLKTAPQPSAPLVATVPPRPVDQPLPAAVVADRTRMAALVEMTAQGAEAETECREAIRAGTTPEEYASTAAARAILDAVAASRR